jgi:hypothetical protein
VAIATKMLNDNTKPRVRTLQAMSSQGTNGTDVDDNHFTSKLERIGNIAGVENVAEQISSCWTCFFELSRAKPQHLPRET